MMSTLERLVYMANQIGKFFAHEGEDKAAISVAEIQSAGMAQQSSGMGGGYWGGYPGLTGGLYGWDNGLANGGYAGPYNNYDQGWNGANGRRLWDAWRK